MLLWSYQTEMVYTVYTIIS